MFKIAAILQGNRQRGTAAGKDADKLFPQTVEFTNNAWNLTIVSLKMESKFKPNLDSKYSYYVLSVLLIVYIFNFLDQKIG